MGVQRAINGQLITWEVIVYGFLGMEQVAARYKDPWKAAVYCCEHNCAEVKMALSEPDDRYRQTTNRSGRGIQSMPRPTVQGRL